jgi:hypothetical protein
MDSSLAATFAKEHGGQIVYDAGPGHRAWAHNGRVEWDELATKSRDRYRAIAYEVVARFLLWYEGREEIAAEERGR